MLGNARQDASVLCAHTLVSNEFLLRINVFRTHFSEASITAQFEDTAPRVFFVLQRFLSADQLDAIRRDYAHAHQAGGNEEPFMSREEGVSFNPRLARILSILAKDLGVHELAVLRAALYAACNDAAGDRADIPPELRPLVVPNAEGHFDDPRAHTIQAVLALDSVRHLHQSSRTPSQKGQVLKDAESLLIEAASAGIPDMLSKKLQHACAQQRRLLALQ